MKMKNKKRIIYILMIAALASAFTGCKKNASENEEQTTQSSAPEGTLINIYHPEDSDVVVEDERYQLSFYTRPICLIRIMWYLLNLNWLKSTQKNITFLRRHL